MMNRTNPSPHERSRRPRVTGRFLVRRSGYACDRVHGYDTSKVQLTERGDFHEPKQVFRVVPLRKPRRGLIDSTEEVVVALHLFSLSNGGAQGHARDVTHASAPRRADARRCTNSLRRGGGVIAVHRLMRTNEKGPGRDPAPLINQSRALLRRLLFRSSFFLRCCSLLLRFRFGLLRGCRSLLF